MAQSSVAVQLRSVIGISCSVGNRNIDLPNQSRDVLLCRSLLHIIIACNGTTVAALLRHRCLTGQLHAPLDNYMKAMARGEGGGPASFSFLRRGDSGFTFGNGLVKAVGSNK